jgi:arginyl-tRNA synthetase
MLAEQKQTLIDCLNAAVKQHLPDMTPNVVLERPKVAQHGDMATNVAMQLAKSVGQPPRVLAQSIIDLLMADPQAKKLIASAELAGPGFINFRLSHTARCVVLDSIRDQGSHYGRQARLGQKILVEFVSANPTGPLHVGHARQAALGDAICHLFDAVGYDVNREFYYNDAGNQIENLAISVQARARGIEPDHQDFPQDGYKGDYVLDVARDYLDKKRVQASDGLAVEGLGDPNDIEAIRRFAVAYLRREQDIDLNAFGLKFDQYFLESSLYASGQVEHTVEKLVASGYTYEHEGALWLQTTALGTGDDKDRVMRKSEGGYTYFVPDVAYHVNKWSRGFTHAVNIQGSDHHGTVARVRAGLQALNVGAPKDYPSYILHKMVKVVRGGVEVKISKRAGSYVTLRDLIDWVGQDAVRFFLIQRRADTEFVFDIDLARSKSEENPVYYVQYAHARIFSMIAQAGLSHEQVMHAPTAFLVAPTEVVLMQRLAEFGQTIALAAQELSPHVLAFWLRDCAADFHAWYNAERVLVENLELKAARLRLAAATRQVLANGLALLGVSAPDRM